MTLSRLSFVTACALASMSSAHAAKYDTPEARLKYVKKMGGYAQLQTMVNCKELTLEFKTTLVNAGIPYDHYRVSGCGMQVDWVATASEGESNGYVVTSWRSSVGVQDAEFLLTATTQLKPMASFDLSCPDPTFTPLQELHVPLHNRYQATLGVAGCGKQLTYESTCEATGVTNGHVDVTCVAKAHAPAAP